MSPLSTMYQSGMRCGRPLGPIVAIVTTRSSPKNACISSSLRVIWERLSAIGRLLLGVDDLVPHLGVLLLVLGPDLLLGQLAERGDVGLVHLHALGLEDLLGLGEVVHALGGLTDLLLGLHRHVR